MKRFTVIYSSHSIEALEKLIEEFLLTFNIHDITINDMFWYGVFCNVNAYANFDEWDAIPPDVEKPEILYCNCTPYEKRYAYVESLINDILEGKERKPQWMVEIEMIVKEEGFAPSTFLYIKEKDKEYEKLGKLIIDFLYSPNLINTLKNC